MQIYIYIYIHIIMKTICSPGYYHNGFVATLTSVRFEQSVCRGSLMTTYMYIYISGNK